MDLLLDCLCLLMCRKVPSELAINKVDTLALKIKMLPRPEKVNYDKPTQAVLRLTPTLRPGS